MSSIRTRHLTLLVSSLVLVACSDRDVPTPSEVDPALLESSLAAAPPAAFNGSRPVRVMTRNLYLGGDIGPVLAASDPAQIPLLVGQIWGNVQATDFPSRAKAIAHEVATTRPDLIGLQEVAIFRVQAPGDFLLGNPVAAEEVAYDYLAILLDELRQAGLHYRVAASIENVDVELPAATSPTAFIDVRYTDRDVVLVGPGVQIQAAVSSHFSANLTIPVAGAIPITIWRGWNRVDLKHRGRELTFVNTHPETDEASVTVQEAQAQELIRILANADRPTIVVGDLNGTPTGTQTYGFFQAAGFVDTWTEAHPTEDGFTCCFAADLSGGTLFERIDYVLARGGVREEPLIGSVRLVGDAPDRRGILASDHAGIVADVGFAEAP